MQGTLSTSSRPTVQCGRSILAQSLVILSVIVTQDVSAESPRVISRSALHDKIQGGWAGQMIGVAFGAPTEFRSNARILEGELAWTPDMLENTLHQDDLYVEMTFAQVMDNQGLDATCQQYGAAFKDTQYQLWHANAGARRALNQGIEAPWSGHPKYNFHANDIDFQIEADFIGLMCPGLPRETNKYCDRVGRVMNYGDGLYGGMFVCGMYAAAYFAADPRQIVEAGVACLPADSQYARLIHDVLVWSAQHPDDWRHVWQQIEDKWDVDDACPDGFQTDFNIDAKLNGAYIALGLLYGRGDFDKTLEIATRCGQDSDCNPSSAAGILGVVLGLQQIPAKYTEALPSLANRDFDYTSYSFDEIVESTEARALRVIERAGGTISASEVRIPAQTARPAALEQWSPGIPDRRIGHRERAWSWWGDWRQRNGMRIANQTGCRAKLKFNGVAVAILGRLDQSGGRATVLLDGEMQELVLDSYIVPNTHDNVLWQIGGLAPGEHTLEIIAIGQADQRSEGKLVAIGQAVVYQSPTSS